MITLTRTAQLPDPMRIARCLRAPELGPRILFFSGGNALRQTSRVLKRYTHNSIHLITPFDSGGSSRVLREAFGMLSVGDLRNRIMSLADESARGKPSITELFSHRLEAGTSDEELVCELEELWRGTHPLVAAVPAPMRRLIRTHLRIFAEWMPVDFDLRGASVGNLILVGGYLNNDRDMDSVVFLFSRLVAARGTVLPVVDAQLHLEVTLEDGASIVGQHRFTGKEMPPIDAPIARMRLVGVEPPHEPASVAIDDKIEQQIAQADLVVFPIGSFYSSVLASLLPRGVGAAIAAVECPRIYVPNTGADPEQLGMSIGDAVERLVARVRADAGDVPVDRILNAVLVDTQSASYATRLDLDRVRAMGIQVADLPLVEALRPDRVDPQKLSEVLVSLA